MTREEAITLKVINCQDFDSLLNLLDEESDIISTSRIEPVAWNRKKVVKGIQRIMSFGRVNHVTRSCGLRAKVCELLMADNYGDEYPDELKGMNSVVNVMHKEQIKVVEYKLDK